MGDNKFIIEVEKAKESVNGKSLMGPVYRSLFAKDGFPEPVQGLESCWDVFRISVEKYPGNRMLGRREIVDGKPGKYLWQTYKEVYDIVMKVGFAIRSCAVEKVSSESYSLDANLCLLRLYQFEPERMSTQIVACILVKALAMPAPDFSLCLFLIPERVQMEEQFKALIVLSHYLETARFRQFWDEAVKNRRIIEVVPGFFD